MAKKCTVCGQPATWYGQQMDGAGQPLTFTAPGWHYRGFTAHPFCNSCHEQYRQLSAKEIGEIKREQAAK